MSSLCTCAVVFNKPTCLLCGGLPHPQITEEEGDRMSFFNTLTSRENVLSFAIDPEDWNEEEETQLREALGPIFMEKTEASQAYFVSLCKRYVYSIVHEAFWDEYVDLVEEINPYMTVQNAYSKRVELGRKGFHLYLGKELRYKSFCQRFYDTLREHSSVGEAEMREQFELMVSNNWSYDDYSRHLRTR